MAQNANNPKVKSPLVTAKPQVSVDGKVTTVILPMTTGSATAGTLVENVGINQEDTLFGGNSDVATCIRRLRKVNEVSQINAIGLDASAGTASTGSIVFTGTATSAGEIDIYIGNEDRKYSVGIVIGDTATDVGDTLEGLITADVAQALVSSVNTTGSVALTAINKGTIGNDVNIRVDESVAGISVALTAMSGGVTDPAVAGLVSLLEDRTDIITHSEYDYNLFVDLLDGRFNSDNIALDGRVIIAVNDTKDDAVTLLNAENSQSLVVFPDKPVDKTTKKGSAVFSMPYERCATFETVRTLRLEEGEVITDFVVTRAPRDQFGGVALNSLPLFNSPTTLPIVPNGEGYTDAEVKEINDAGGSLLGNNRAKNGLITDQILTTYKKNSAGQEDITYKFLEYVDTSTACREFILESLAIDYAQARLTKGSPLDGRDIADKSRVRADIMGYMETLGDVDNALLQSGVVEETGETISEIIGRNLKIDIDIANGLIFIQTILPIMTQTREILSPLSIVFDVTKF